MLIVRLAGDHLHGKQLIIWLSLMVSLMASFILSLFPLDVLDEIWDVIESVCKGFLTYSYEFGTTTARLIQNYQKKSQKDLGIVLGTCPFVSSGATQ